MWRLSLVPRLSHTITVSDKKLGDGLGTRLVETHSWYSQQQAGEVSYVPLRPCDRAHGHHGGGMAGEELPQARCKVPDLVVHFTKGDVVTGVCQVAVATKSWTA